MRTATKESRVFGLGGFLVDRYAGEWARAMAPAWRARSRSVARDLAVMLAHAGVVGTTIALAARAAAEGNLSIAAATSTLPAIAALGTTLDCFAVAEIGRGLDAYRAMRRLPELVETRLRSLAGPAHPAPSGAPVADVGDVTTWPRRSIRFEGVSFRYPGAGSDVLHGLDLEIAAGCSMALVGVNGAGKSTLVKLLAGCYRPTAGRILVDGIDLAVLGDRELARWQRRIAAIVQDFLRFPLSAADNVRFGAMERGDDQASLAAVAARAGLDGLVAGLPDGWATPLDPSFDGGVDLSGGQWQRVALARALFAVRAGARVLVLDEPAAALDGRAEAELVSRYLDLTAGLCSLIISHRFSIVRDASTICVLDGGRIVERGSHAELLAADGQYARLFRLQSQRYLSPDAAHG
jgi:ABC-type multidrug transport system fused ATPase/permease subunit